MTTEDRWQKLDAIWRSALQLEGSSRAEYVRQACAGDEALRSEIESLLGFEQNAGDFLEPPGASQDSGLSGRSIAHYQVLEKLGEGGMGVVYKAFDTHLNRPVAIKVLRPEVVADPDRRRRFVLEARSASALNHPNIITVYDITTDRGFNLIVMEYVEGKRLADLIPRHGMPQAELLKVAVQIAEALSAAHGRGIVHRDVKPANTMVTNGGLVKLLDFGLAKLIEPDTREPGATRTGTLQPETETGAILGTVAYMSPEQAAGRKVDARTDIFSFGAMLYEMASGRQPFRGGTRMETVSAILSSEPAPIPGIPQDLEKVITRCLRKDPDRRFQHMDDVAVALRELKEESDSRALGAAAHSAAPGARRRRVTLVFAALSALLLAAFLFWRFGMQSPQAPTSVVPLTAYPGSEITPAFSPDGKQVAFSWNGPKEDNFDIYVSLIGTSTPPVRLTTDAAGDACPVWSPDGRWIAFVRRGRNLMLMPALGGPERGLSEIAPPSGALRSGIDWSPDGRYIAFPAVPSPGGPQQIMLLSPDTGERRAASFPPAGSGDAMPRFSPDGKYLAWLRRRSDLYNSVAVVPLAGGEARIVTPDTARVDSLAWTGDSREFVLSAGPGGLWRMPSDGKEPLTPIISVPRQVSPFLALSRRGRDLVYTLSFVDGNIWRLDLIGGRQVGSPVKLIASTWWDGAPDFSPDGRRIAFGSKRSGHLEIWVCAADGSGAVQVTSIGADETGSPRWRPDGRTIAFDSNRDAMALDIYTVAADGGPVTRITDHPAFDAAPTWSRDGRWIYFTSDRTGERQIWKVPAEGGSPVQVTRHGGVNAFESTDGKTLYYAKDIDGRGAWKLRIDSGEETPVMDHPGRRRWGHMHVIESGIYFVDVTGDPKQPRDAIFFFNFQTQRKTEIALLDKRASSGARGIALSPDGRSLLFVQIDSSGSDLMLVRNFR